MPQLELQSHMTPAFDMSENSISVVYSIFFFKRKNLRILYYSCSYITIFGNTVWSSLIEAADMKVSFLLE